MARLTHHLFATPIRTAHRCQVAVLPFQPKYRLAHPKTYLFSLSKKKLFWMKVSQKTFYLILKKEALLHHQWDDFSCSTVERYLQCFFFSRNIG